MKMVKKNINVKMTEEKSKLIRKKAFERFVAFVFVAGVMIFASPMTTFAATGGGAAVTAGLGSLQELVLAFVSAIGMILCAWGIGEWGISTSSQDGTTQASALKRIGGGIVMVLAPQILATLV
ncbi:hypothetical protein M2454_000772 [Aequitasia blattaphilus]|uniref:Conjugal transfer protein TrbC n=1 Tax=Aequitasia blattaphilus TaxID=2949332 RepID=A0ABT1E8M3_9FIRM|nr:hypothetical protein [Aequitasia blattaphilus]MCP1101979.1 hypothetical protein [Aequitasia blattaphilus]MCR8614619.1 hypothetical protein [Aequitasia blattaphilus]